MGESPFEGIQLELESDRDFTFPLATNIVVNFDSEHFYIRFYQATPPLPLNGEIPESVKAKLVAGAAIPLSKMDGIVKALQENYERRIETLPEYLDEDEVDDFLVRNGIIDKLLAQIEQTPRSQDWEAELNEL